MTNAEMINVIRNALEAKYEFPHYALIRVTPTHGPCFHIPAPFFDGPANNPRSMWAGNLPIAKDKRDGEYYECPCCGERSYYAGVCQDCKRAFEVWDNEEERWIDGLLPIEYQNHEALKRAVKAEFLRRLDSGMQDIGIVSAEIVLSNPPSNVCGENHSPFFKSESWTAQSALDHIEKEEYMRMIMEYVPADGMPVDYIEGDEIEVEGTDEKRRHQDNVWWHKHPSSGYDYWHPMARVHKDTCSVCGAYDPEGIKMDSHFVCCACAKADPRSTITGVIERGRRADMRYIINDTHINPDEIEEKTDFAEVPWEAYHDMFFGRTITLVVMGSEQNRYFALLPIPKGDGFMIILNGVEIEV